MEPDLLTNEMVKAALQPLDTVADQTLDLATRTGIPPKWLFAIVLVIVMGKSFGRVLERVVGMIERLLDGRRGNLEKKED